MLRGFEREDFVRHVPGPGGAVMRTLSRAVFLRKPGWERGVFGRWRGTGHAYGGHRVDACIDCAEYAYARLMCGDLGDETDHG